MLILSRKRNESIRIENNVVLTVIEVKGQCVRLGIEAPQNVAVHRKELVQRIPHRERDRDAQPSESDGALS